MAIKKFKIKNLKLKINSGFTLVELMVVTAVAGVLAVGLSGSLFAIYKGQSKALALEAVRQDGARVITKIERMIYNSKSIDCSGTPSVLKITDENDLESILTLLIGSRFPITGAAVENLLDSSLIHRTILDDSGVNSFTCEIPSAGENFPVKVKLRMKLLYLPAGASRPEESAAENFSAEFTARNY